VRKKLVMLAGVVLIVAGAVLYHTSAVQQDEAMVESLGVTRSVATPFGTEEEQTGVRGHEELAHTMKTGALICWGAGAVLLAIGYLMKKRGRTAVRLGR